MLLVHYNNCLSKQTWGFLYMERKDFTILCFKYCTVHMYSNKCTVSRLQGFSPTPSPKILLVVNQKKT